MPSLPTQDLNAAANPQELDAALLQLVALQDELNLVTPKTFYSIKGFVEDQRRNRKFEEVTSALWEYIKIFTAVKNLRAVTNQTPSFIYNGEMVDLNELSKAAGDLIAITIVPKITCKDTLKKLNYIKDIAEKTCDLIREPDTGKAMLLEIAGNQLNSLKQSKPTSLLKAYIKTIISVVALVAGVVGVCLAPWLCVPAAASLAISLGSCLLGIVVPAIFGSSAEEDFIKAEKQTKSHNLQSKLGLFSPSPESTDNQQQNIAEYGLITDSKQPSMVF